MLEADIIYYNNCKYYYYYYYYYYCCCCCVLENAGKGLRALKILDFRCKKN